MRLANQAKLCHYDLAERPSREGGRREIKTRAVLASSARLLTGLIKLIDIVPRDFGTVRRFKVSPRRTRNARLSIRVPTRHRSRIVNEA